MARLLAGIPIIEVEEPNHDPVGKNCQVKRRRLTAAHHGNRMRWSYLTGHRSGNFRRFAIVAA